jgi:hypothetical protein
MYLGFTAGVDYSQSGVPQEASHNSALQARTLVNRPNQLLNLLDRLDLVFLVVTLETELQVRFGAHS